MKDKNRAGGIIGVIIVYLVAALYTAVFAIGAYKDFSSALLFVAGGAACFIISAAAHEGGHILAAKIFGYKVIGFSVWMFKFDLTAKRKFSIGRSDYAGETDVIPVKDGKYLKGYKAVIFGGIAGGCIACAAITTAYFAFSFNKYAAISFTSFPLVAAWFLINAVPNLIKNSDGTFLKELAGGENAETMEKYLGVLYLLYAGDGFSEIDEEKFSLPSENCLLYEEILVIRLMRAEETGDGEGATEAIGLLKNLDCRLADTDKELLVALALKGDFEGVEDLKYVLPLCDGADDLRSMRTLVAYASARGDVKYVETAKPTIKKAASLWYLKGEGKFTEKILEKF